MLFGGEEKVVGSFQVGGFTRARTQSCSANNEEKLAIIGITSVVPTRVCEHNNTYLQLCAIAGAGPKVSPVYDVFVDLCLVALEFIVVG